MPDIPPEPPEPEPDSPGPDGPPGPPGDPAAAPVEPIQYREVTSDTFAAGVSLFTALPIPGGVSLTGPCPRCGHAMESLHLTKVFLSTPSPSSVASQPRPPTGDVSAPVNMACTCSVLHTGCPEGANGCGAYWNVMLGPAES